jgi:hypothetical protein
MFFCIFKNAVHYELQLWTHYKRSFTCNFLFGKNLMLMKEELYGKIYNLQDPLEALVPHYPRPNFILSELAWIVLTSWPTRWTSVTAFC